jgi:hypothetical protein
MDLHVDDEQAGRLAAELDTSSRITLIFYRRASRRYARSMPSWTLIRTPVASYTDPCSADRGSLRRPCAKKA